MYGLRRCLLISRAIALYTIAATCTTSCGARRHNAVSETARTVALAASAPCSASRLLPGDAALMSASECASLSPWFHGIEPRYPQLAFDAAFSSLSGVIVATDFGATPDDGIDDTDELQAAVDAAHAVHVATGNGVLLYVRPGIYQVDNVYLFPGLTVWGYGATWQRPSYAWYLAECGSPAAADIRLRASRVVNGYGYYQRNGTNCGIGDSYVAYRWNGPGRSPPMRVLGLTVDGNRSALPDATDYQYPQTHGLAFATDPDSGGILEVELTDVAAINGPADGLAIVSNVDATITRFTSLDNFRGDLTSLGSNSRIVGRDLYLSGDQLIRGIDSEPVGTASADIDVQTGEALSPMQRSARSYWDLDRVVLGGNLDIALPVIPAGSTTYQGGRMVIRHMAVLRNVLLNVIPYGSNADGAPVVEIVDSTIHVGQTTTPIDYTIEPEDHRRWGLSKVRWPGHVRFERVAFILEVPSDAQLDAVFTPRDGYLPPAQLVLTALEVDMTSLAAPWPDGQAWPQRLLEFSDCTWAAPGLATSSWRSKLLARAIAIHGDAASDHVVIARGGAISAAYDVAVALDGGRLVMRAIALGAPSSICSLARAPYGWTYQVDVEGIAPATYTECSTGSGTVHWE